MTSNLKISLAGLAWIGLLSVHGACGPRPLPPEPPVVVVISSEAGTACGRACDSLRANGCPEGFPNRAGHSCEKTCEDAVAEFLFPASFPECIARATSHAERRACGVRCGEL